MWPPGAKEDELDPLPWLNVSALVSLSAFLCSLFIYKIIKRRQDILWATGSHLQQKLIFTRGIKFSKRNLARSVFPGRASLGFSLATTGQGSRAQQMESFIIISFGLFLIYAGKLSLYMQGNFPSICRETFLVYMQGKSKEISGISNFAVASASILFTIGLAIIVATRMVKAFFHYQHHQLPVNLEYVHCQ